MLVHGFWHGTWCWSEVIAELAGLNRAAVAVDMAGHGLRAPRPICLSRRPLDPIALTTEVSPVAEVDLDRAGALLAAQIEGIGGGDPVTVVAHSMGGAVLTRAAQMVPGLVSHAVYLTAFMPASGVPAGSYVSAPENAGELVAPLVVGDPMAIGALRLDLASADADYRERLRVAFFGDVDTSTADAAIGLLTPDAPVQIAGGATTLTADGWGSVRRTYVMCTQDMSIRPGLQQRFVTDADTAFPGSTTSVHSLDTGHSPFLTMPRQVAEIIARAT